MESKNNGGVKAPFKLNIMSKKELLITFLLVALFLFCGFWLLKGLILLFCIIMLNPVSTFIFTSIFLVLYIIGLKQYDKWKR